ASGKRVSYDDLQHRVDQTVANEGYGCLANATQPAGGAQALAGTWSGVVTQNGVSPFTIVVSLASPVTSAAGLVKIPSSGCVGSVRYRKTDGQTHTFAMTWRQGGCLSGVMTLRVVDAQTVQYTWAGHYDDGSPARSSARLTKHVGRV